MPRAATEGLGIDSGWLRLGFAPGMEGSTAARQPGFKLQPIIERGIDSQTTKIISVD